MLRHICITNIVYYSDLGCGCSRFSSAQEKGRYLQCLIWLKLRHVIHKVPLIDQMTDIDVCFNKWSFDMSIAYPTGSLFMGHTPLCGFIGGLLDCQGFQICQNKEIIFINGKSSERVP